MFFDFLEDHDVTTRFFINARYHLIKNEMPQVANKSNKGIVECLCKYNNTEGIVCAAFTWRCDTTSSPEDSHSFWNKLDGKWRTIVKDLRQGNDSKLF
jgi:hypothetical protein